jgi:hypothetical protein
MNSSKILNSGSFGKTIYNILLILKLDNFDTEQFSYREIFLTPFSAMNFTNFNFEQSLSTAIETTQHLQLILKTK